MLAPDVSRLAPTPSAPARDAAPAWVAAGTPEPLRSELIDTLGSDRVLTRALDLIAYASDASPYRLIPQAVVMSRDVEDIRRLLALARRLGSPLVFRAGGTSLNGQAQTDSILVDARRHWRRIRIMDAGARVRVQPGAVLGHVNRMLSRHGRKLGPDPASTDIACVGGVIANNSGGMRCGVTADSYQTVRAMKLVLASGAVIDTAGPGAEDAFAAAAPDLARGLLEIRDEIRADSDLAQRIRRKFEIKNTTGYRLCALLDADTPLEMFRRLVVGSEGTLAFVAEAEFETVALGAHTSVSLALFEDVDAAVDVVGELVAVGATATELMVAPTLIAAAYNMPGTPERWRALPPTAAALLIEFRDDDPSTLDARERTAVALLSERRLLDPAGFSRDHTQIEMLWRVREGMQGLLAAMRPPGVSLIIEDVCFPPARLAEATQDLQALLGEHGFLPGVAGHASAGNLHFLLTPNFGDPADLERYDAFMHALVELVVDRYDGSLKAEHGTGRNMAPFVEREWGATATALMWRIKALADPDGLLGPGVVLNRDERIHLRNLKSTPEIEAVATKCIECGFCEPVCPSRHLTTTPRQRIVLRREMARQPVGSPVLEALIEQFRYDGMDTCAVDGSCKHACPVAIDTGQLVKGLRALSHSPRDEHAAAAVAAHYASAERAARAGVRAGGVAARVVGDRGVGAITDKLRHATGDERLPEWAAGIPAAAPARLPFTLREGAAAVYMPSCINRIFGNDRREDPHPTVPEALVAVSRRAGLPLWIPEDVAGHCCATPWTSKGFVRGAEVMRARTAAALERWSDGGRLPVVIDATSCTHGVLAELAPEGVSVLDSIDWVHDHLLGHLAITGKLEQVTVHTTCSATHLGLGEKLHRIAAALAESVVVPARGGCCGMAGDRGWLHPELPASALGDLADELRGRALSACLSSNRTCEVALREVTGLPYASFVQALEALTQARDAHA